MRRRDRAVELIGLRYRLDGFVPVIFPAATATALARIALGTET